MSMFTTCQQSDKSVLTASSTHTAQTLKDVPYGKDSAQKMDVYLPEGRSADSTKAIILIHGGGWNSGNKSDFVSYIDSFRRRMPDYAVFNLNYRLYNGDNLFPTQEEDVKAAVDFISAHAKDYGIDRNRLVLLGASAGAHLALLQAYKYTDPKFVAVIDFFGPTDLTAMYEKPWHPFVPMALQTVLGTVPSANAALYRQSSPVNFVERGTPPTLIFHGSQDPIVDLSQSRLLEAALRKAGVTHELVVYSGQRHGWYGSTLSNSFDRIERFLKQNVN